VKFDCHLEEYNGRLRSLVLQVLRFCLLLACLFVLGCGPEPGGVVSGKVTYKGAPLTAGVVNFHSDKGHASQGTLDSAGAFKLAGELPPGTYKVFLLPPTPKQLEPGKPIEKVAFDLPPKLQDVAQTPVTQEVKKGPNEVTITLPD